MYKNVGIKPSVQKLVRARKGERSWSDFIEEMVKTWDLVSRGLFVPADISKMTIEEKNMINKIVGTELSSVVVPTSSPLIINKAIVEQPDDPLTIACQGLEIDDVDVTRRKEYNPKCPLCVHPDCLKFEALWWKTKSHNSIRDFVELKGMIIGKHMNEHKY